MNQGFPLRILIADPHRVVCDGIAAVLARQPDLCVVGQARYGPETINLFCKLPPDVLMMERHFPDMDGKIVIANLKAKFSADPILVLSLHDEQENVYTALKAGAQGYLPKDVTGETLAEGVRWVSTEETVIPPTIAKKLADRLASRELSGREREVLQYIVAGPGRFANPI